MNKRELSEQLQQNLLTEFDGVSDQILDRMCDIVNNTIMRYDDKV
jgi:hypothetical protein